MLDQGISDKLKTRLGGSCLGTGVRRALQTCAILLVLAVIPIWPYGFYIVLRVVVWAVSIYVAVMGKELSRSNRTLAVLIAVLFNPISIVSLSRPVWFPIDLTVAYYFWHLGRPESRKEIAERALDLAYEGVAREIGLPATFNLEAADRWRRVVRERHAKRVVANRKALEVWEAAAGHIMAGTGETAVSVVTLQNQRAEAWAMARRLADPRVRADQFQYIDEAKQIDARIERAFANAGEIELRDRWRALLDESGAITREFRNKAVDYFIRQVPPDEMVDILLHPDRPALRCLAAEAATLGGRLSASEVAALGLTGVEAEELNLLGREALDYAQLIPLLRNASGGDKAFDTVRATAALHLLLDTAENVGVLPRMLNGNRILEALEKLGGVDRREIKNGIQMTRSASTFKGNAAYELFGEPGLQFMRDLGFALEGDSAVAARTAPAPNPAP